MSPDIYLLLSGSVNVSVDDRIVQIIDKRGSFIGELSPLINQPGVSTLTAATECECIVIPIRYLQDVLGEHPEDGVNLLGVLAGHIIKRSKGLPGLDMDLEEIGLGSQIRPKTDKELSEKRRIILVARKDSYRAALDFHFEPMGFEIEQVNEPEAIIQNLDSLEADLIIFNSIDFPRHWKPLLSLLRERKSLDETVFILISSRDFTFDEAAKAAHLKVNGIIPENLLDKKVLFQLNDLVRRYKTINDKRKFNRVVPKEAEIFRLLFTHPTKKTLISGVISDISLEGCNFTPSDPAQTSDFALDSRIRGCSLRIGEDIVTIHCRITRNRTELGLEFESFEEDGHEKLFKYLMERPEREMQHQIKRDSQS